MNSVVDSKDATVYHYKLVRKLPHQSPTYLVLPALLTFAIVALALAAGPVYAVVAGLAVGGWLPVYRATIRGILSLQQDSSVERWSWRKGWPWFGYLPNGNYSLRKFIWVHAHMIGIGAVLALLLLPWSHWGLWGGLLFAHLWITLPRLASALWLSKGSPKYGVLRIGEQETSYYLP